MSGEKKSGKKGGKKGGKRDGAAPLSRSPRRLRREAEAQVRTNAAALRALTLPPDVEPASVFRP